jgi:dTDP-4-amino-4,6-dideoxy-D-galactose acyltransferase
VSNSVKTTAQPAVCTYLDWDSQFFGLRIARLNLPRLEASSTLRALSWCQENAIDCLYFLADAEDAETIRLAQENNFLQTDVRITLERALNRDDRILREFPAGVRVGDKSDLTVLREIARTGHQASRFYFDPHFERSQCGLLYQTWLERSFEGFAQAVLVAEVNGEPVGYATCHLRDRESQIGLFGIRNNLQGKGIGKTLLRGFLAWSAKQGAERATVVTQGRNVRAQRLYQRSGFVTFSLQLWYHCWFTSGVPDSRRGQ